ncbi:unnamed protein product [Cercopithifilaria johnstoni]|uniref:Uncharacterized protein n=1 Tax=Cercopithifilaria johnstoni TaxID=2874296 RepID=A0A8J2MAN2_9BILA|nr:unnamed protein product [Cercopithifilaria johnstoni]
MDNVENSACSTNLRPIFTPFLFNILSLYMSNIWCTFEICVISGVVHAFLSSDKKWEHITNCILQTIIAAIWRYIPPLQLSDRNCAAPESTSHVTTQRKERCNSQPSYPATTDEAREKRRVLARAFFYIGLSRPLQHYAPPFNTTGLHFGCLPKRSNAMN